MLSSSSIRILVINALAVALVFTAATFIHIRIPIAGTGGMIHLGDLPLFVFAILYGRNTGALAGAIGLTLFDLLSGWVLWAPFTFVITGAIGWIVGYIAEKNPDTSITAYWVSIAAATVLTITGYYAAEGFLYGNWLAPLGSVPINFLQTTIAGVLAYPVAVRLKKIKKI